ncbi:TetR family transcriptional regulator [Streptomyces sp. NPDC055078]
MTVEPTVGPAGLRERKKQLTRDALVRAALELFTTQGYEETTVDEIADAVDVSQRTFFRYFAGKEEAAFSVQRLAESRFLAALRERPPHESPFEILCQAMTAGWDILGDTIEEIIPVELHMRSYLMIESTPSLLASHLRHSMEVEEEITQLIARREGIDAATDARPRVAVAAFCGVMRAAGAMWARGDDWSIRALRDLTTAYLDQLGPALTERWNRPPAEII